MRTPANSILAVGVIRVEFLGGTLPRRCGAALPRLSTADWRIENCHLWQPWPAVGHPAEIARETGERVDSVGGGGKSHFSRKMRARNGAPGAIKTGHPARSGADFAGGVFAEGGKKRYTKEDIDVIAAHVQPVDALYLIPIEKVGRAKSLRLYSGIEGRAKKPTLRQGRGKARRKSRPAGQGARKSRSAREWERWQEAWEVIGDPGGQ